MTTSITDPSSIRPWAARGAVIAGSASAALMVLAQLTQPEVVVWWQPPSELALGPTGWAMTVGFIGLGLACLLLFLALRGQTGSRVGAVGRWALVVAAVGGVMAGVFPTDRWDVVQMTPSGMAHSMAPMLLEGVPVASVLLAISLVRRSCGWSGQWGWLVGGAAVVVGAAVVLSVSMALFMAPGGGLGPEVPVGLQARALLLADALWVVMVGACASRVRGNVARLRQPSSARGRGVDVVRVSS